MTPHYADGQVTLWHGDCLDVLRELPDASVHSVVTGPPYGIAFMGKAWDQPGEFGSARRNGQPAVHAREAGRDRALVGDTGAMDAGRYDLSPHAMRNFQRWCEAWAVECLRVLKPGGHMLAFGGSRTWHRLASAIEDAGFEIRDSIAWLYGSGFPKSLDVSKAIDKLAGAEREPGAPVRDRTNHLRGERYASGPSGFSTERGTTLSASEGDPVTAAAQHWNGWGEGATVTGRWPTNVVLDDTQAAELDRQSGVLTSGKMPAGTQKGGKASGIYGEFKPQPSLNDTPGDAGGASRFFPRFTWTADDLEWQARVDSLPTFRYEAKASTAERPRVDGVAHPTVKPLDLMRWLVRLVTPAGGTVLEPFAGSGTTVEACLLEGFRCVAIEREADYLPLIEHRIRKPHTPALDLGALA